MDEVDRFRSLGHAMIDRIADYLRAAEAREMPVLPWHPPEDELAAWPGSFNGTIGGDADELLTRLLSRSIHLHHPRFVGHQVPPPLPEATLWTLAASILNNGMAIYEMGPAVTAMERRVCDWLAGVLGMPEGGGGILTSGGSVGNLTALLAARKAAPDGPVAFLVGETAHYSIKRALQVMGVAAEPVASDESFRLRPDDLPAALARAEAAGRRVIGLVASAGSTATGAYDPLVACADFCAAQGLWLHVDGAHGAAAAFSPRHRWKVAGIERADSVVVDAHKLMMQPALVTFVLFRDGRKAYGAFAEEASYLYETDDRWYDIGLRTLECTKRMLAVPVYAFLALRGEGALTAHVERLFDRAQRFAEHLGASSDFEVLPPEANIVCFRHLVPELDAAALDEHQTAVREAIIRGGGFYLVKTRLRDKTWLRVSIMNPATEDEDLRALADAVRAR